MELSSYQKAILDEWNNTDHNLAIEAGPGSGKTFMLLQLAKTVKMSDSAIFLAFNKSIAEELSKKLPFYMKAMTLHSLGMRTLLRTYGFSMIVKEDKTFLVCKKYFDQFKFYGEHGKDFKKKMAYIFSLAQVYDLYRFNMVENIDELKDLCVDYDIPALGDIDMENLKTMIHIMDTYNQMLEPGGMIDFTDMLWLCKDIPKSKFQQYKKVFVDECQDLNSLQRMMVEKILSPNGRLVSVGDSFQSIYIFAGASLSNFQELKNRPNTVTLPLSITYRCSRHIVDKANEVFEGLESAPGAEDGIVEPGAISEIQPGDFVLCRNNKPLVQVYIRLLRNNLKASIYGKDYEKKLLKLLDKCGDVDDKIEALDILNQERIALVRELESKGYSNPEMHPSVGSFDEAYQILEILFDEKGVQGSRSMIEKMFRDDIDSKSVMLMTCHKSKGLEADRVFFLNQELIPSQYATSPQMLYAEKCLAYVTITRAKKVLKYIHIGDNDGRE